MQTNENKASTREFKVYIHSLKAWVPVSEDQYYAYYRDIWATRKRAQAHGRCMCPKSKIWLCEGDCGICEFQAAGDMLSLDYVTEGNEGEGVTMGDSLVDTSVLIEDIIADAIQFEELAKALEELSPEAQQICQLYKGGMSERQIADFLGIPRSTFKRQWDRIKAQLHDRLKDYR